MAMTGWSTPPSAASVERQREERMEAILAFIVRHKVEHDGAAPTIREIVEQVGISSTSVVSYHLKMLEDAGRIQRPFGAARAIVVVGGRWVAPAGMEPS